MICQNLWGEVACPPFPLPGSTFPAEEKRKPETFERGHKTSKSH